MELATLHLDTDEVVKLLQEKGYTKKQAEGFMEAIQEIKLSGVSTKQDLQELRGDMQDLEMRLTEKITKGLSDSLKFQLVQTIGLIAVIFTMFQLFS